MRARPWSRIALLPVVLVAASCGEAQPSVRWQAVPGRSLVYQGTERDTRPTKLPGFGIGGTMETRVKFRATCVSADPDGTGRWETELLELQLQAPEWMAAVADTTTDADEAGDQQQTEAFVRKWLGEQRSAVVQLNGRGMPLSQLARDEVFERDLQKWMALNPPVRMELGQRLGVIVRPVHNLVRWTQSAGFVLPDDPFPPPEAGWATPLPPVNTGRFAGPLRARAEVRLKQEGDVVRIVAEGTFSKVEPEDGVMQPTMVNFVSGAVHIEVDFDRPRGILLRSHEKVELRFAKLGVEREPVEWDIVRDVELVDEPK